MQAVYEPHRRERDARLSSSEIGRQLQQQRKHEVAQCRGIARTAVTVIPEKRSDAPKHSEDLGHARRRQVDFS